MDPLVIIGGGIAGVTCAKVFSMENAEIQVILVSASPLVKNIANLKTLGRSIDIFDVIEQNSSLLQTANLKVINKKAIKLDSKQRRIQLEDESWLKYQKLCICTGAKPRTIQVDDEKTQNFIKYIRDTQTAKDFTNILNDSKRIMVAGNGGIATEIVYAVENVEIIWAIRDNSFGATFFDAGAAKFFSDFLEKHGDKHEGISKRSRFEETTETITELKDQFGVALGPDWSRGLELKGGSKKKVSVESKVELVKIYSDLSSIPETKKCHLELGNQDTWNIYVELTNGKIFGCDMIIVAFGVVPNTEPFLAGNNFKLGTDEGILVDKEMRTNIKDIYAAGDVCTANWKHSTHWFQMRLWTQARQMGFYAAKCIQFHLNPKIKDDPSFYFNFNVFTHVTQFFGFRVILLGLYDGQKLTSNDYKVLCKVIPRKEYIKVILQNHYMKGAILIGDNNLEETFEFLIYNQINLSRFGDHLLDDVLDLEDFFD